MTRFAFLALVALLAPGCAADEPPLFGPPTQSECPPAGSTLTWDNFGNTFMSAYCTRCHHTELRGEARQGAPSFHDFDTAKGVRVVKEHVDETTASGPAATNKSMPPDGPMPTLEERQKLGEWLACGAL